MHAVREEAREMKELNERDTKTIEDIITVTKDFSNIKILMQSANVNFTTGKLEVGRAVWRILALPTR